MSDERVQAIDEAFRVGVQQMQPGAQLAPNDLIPGSETLRAEMAWRIFEGQASSRHVDYAARYLARLGYGYYTIASAGHEANAIVASAARVTDPALLHYRSGAFLTTRALQNGETDTVREMLMGIAASRNESLSGGRHKVIGSKSLHIPPQTSTIASHLPRALGVSFALQRGRKLGLESEHPDDSIVICSFGDASANHATALAAMNAAQHVSFQHLPLPLLFVCEDNGLGISVPTPEGWIQSRFGGQRHLRYFRAEGSDLLQAHDTISQAVNWIRTTRKPAFLHLKVVRLLAHAGSDVELSYRPMSHIRRDMPKDPLLATARTLIEDAGYSVNAVLDRYESIREEVKKHTLAMSDQPKLRDAADVMTGIVADVPSVTMEKEASRLATDEARSSFWGKMVPEREGALTLSLAINRALGEILVKYQDAFIFGEDVARKGGVYGVTRGLCKRASAARVFDTHLDETSILGLALGLGQAGYLPIAEIQYLAYLHNAEDQLRGEAATQQFFSQGVFRNPMIVRIASFGYQKGFGGHFHNDNGLGVLRDIPGLLIAAPSHPADVYPMLQTCAAEAKLRGRVVVWLEPIALYHRKDLHDVGDGGWTASHQASAKPIGVGECGVHGDGEDALLIAYANTLPMALRVQRSLAADGHAVRVLDLRWLAPLPIDAILTHARACKKVLVADETRRSGGVSEGIVTELVDAGFDGVIRRVTSDDSFIPLGPAAHHVLLSERTIESELRSLIEQG